MTNRDRFIAALTTAYTDLFTNDPEYSYSAAKTNPADLAVKMTDGMLTGSANIGDGIKKACKALGIKPSYKAIREYLNANI
jgi:hypothetical protein